MNYNQPLPLLIKTPADPGPDPAQFQALVWQEISHRRLLADTDRISIADMLGGCFRGLALGGAAMAVVIGLTIAMLHDHPARQNPTANALKLGVFHPEAGELPHAFLMVRQ